MRTYRYGIAIFGASYAPPDPQNPAHVWMAETLEDVRRMLRNARADASWRYDETGEGTRILGTPAYGDRGDGAYVFAVDRDNPQFGEVLDEPGDRARHAFAWLLTEYPEYVATFGPRGGIILERA